MDGTLSELFALQDTLSARLARVLTSSVAPSTAPPGGPGSAPTFPVRPRDVGTNAAAAAAARPPGGMAASAIGGAPATAVSPAAGTAAPVLPSGSAGSAGVRHGRGDHPRSPAPDRAGGHPARRRRPRHHARDSSRRSAAARRPARRAHLFHGAAGDRLHPAGAGRRGAGAGSDRGLGAVRPGHVLRRSALLEHRAGPDHRQRDEAGQLQHVRQRDLLGGARHLLRPPQRLQLHHQRARGAVRRHESRTSGRPTWTGTPCGTCGPAASSRAGRWRWRFPSSRSATGPVRRRSGASTSSATWLPRTRRPS